MRNLRLFVFFTLLLSSLSNAATQDINETLGIRTRAMGGAGRAVATTNEALYLNPAGISQFSRFNLDGDYVHRFTEATHWSGVSLVDSTSTPFCGGVDFHMGINATQGSNSIAYLGSFALALPLDRFHVGANVRYAYLPATLTDSLVNQFSVDVGMLALFDYGLSAAVTGYNLVPTNSRRLPLSVGFGVAFRTDQVVVATKNPKLQDMMQGLTVAFDWILRDLTSPNGMQNAMMTGAEYTIASIFPVRAGYTYSLESNEHLFSCGTGFASNDFGIDVFYEQNITNTDDRSFGTAVRLLF